VILLSTKGMDEVPFGASPFEKACISPLDESLRVHRLESLLTLGRNTFQRQAKLNCAHDNSVRKGLLQIAEHRVFSSDSNSMLGDSSVLQLGVVEY